MCVAVKIKVAFNYGRNTEAATGLQGKNGRGGPDQWNKRDETTRSRLPSPPDHKGGWHQEKLVPPAHMGPVGLEGFSPPNPPVFLPLYSHPKINWLAHSLHCGHALEPCLVAGVNFLK